MLRRVLIGGAILGLFTAAAAPASAFSASFSWSGIPACAVISPLFTLSAVPPATKLLDFTMTDLDVPTFHHGGATIPYRGNMVPMGAVRYIGPCPPIGERHRYSWNIDALDETGHLLGTAVATGAFPP